MRKRAVLALVCALVAGSATTASADDPHGTLTGTVKAADGSSVFDACARVDRPDGTIVNTAYSGSDGRWSVDVPPGSYVVQLSDCLNATTTTLAPRWVGGDDRMSTAAVAAVADGVTTPLGDLVLPTVGSISGTVVDQHGSANPQACARIADDPNDVVARFHPLPVDATGRYTLSGLYPRPHYVGFIDCSNQSKDFVSYWPHSSSAELAQTVDVRPGEDTPAIDGTVRVGARVSGTVRDSRGQPVTSPQLWVEAFSGINAVDSGLVLDGQGGYVVTGLPEGPLSLFAQVFNDSRSTTKVNLLGTYLGGGDGTDGHTGRTVQVTDDHETTGQDFVLPDGGEITGHVTDRTGTPVSGACVVAGDGNAETDAQGFYDVVALHSRPALVKVSDCNRTGHHANTWWPHAFQPSNARAIPVQAGTTSTADVALDTVETLVSGRIVDPDGHPLPEACVEGRHATGDTGVLSNTTLVASDGSWTLLNVGPTDDLVISVSDCNGTHGWIGRTLPAIRVVQDQPVDVGDVELGPAGALTGTLVDERGLPPLGVRATATCPGLDPVTTVTDSTGRYTLRGLPGGACTVDFSDAGDVLAFQSWYGSPGPHLPAIVVPGQTVTLLPQLVLTQSVPSPPLGVIGAVGDGVVQVTWQPPTSDGHTAINGYDVVTPTGAVVAHVSGSARSTVVGGLTDGRSYSFAIRATNRKGSSAPSAAIALTPRKGAVLPGTVVPLSLTVTRRGARPRVLIHDLAPVNARRLGVQAQVGKAWKTLVTITEGRQVLSRTWTPTLPRGSSSVRLVVLDRRGHVLHAYGRLRAR